MCISFNFKRISSQFHHIAGEIHYLYATKLTIVVNANLSGYKQRTY